MVQLFQLPSNGLHNTVSYNNSILEACLPRRCIAAAIDSLFVSRSFSSNGSVRHNMYIYRLKLNSRKLSIV
jgi:hypothetical protein